MSKKTKKAFKNQRTPVFNAKPEVLNKHFTLTLGVTTDGEGIHRTEVLENIALDQSLVTGWASDSKIESKVVSDAVKALLKKLVNDLCEKGIIKEDLPPEVSERVDIAEKVSALNERCKELCQDIEWRLGVMGGKHSG